MYNKPQGITLFSVVIIEKNWGIVQPTHLYNNVEKQRAGTEAKDVGAGSRSLFEAFVYQII